MVMLFLALILVLTVNWIMESLKRGLVQ